MLDIYEVESFKTQFEPLEVPLSVGTAKATSFQWYFERKGTTGFVAIPGATAASYNVPIAFLSFGRYRLVATNAYGLVSNETTILRVPFR